MKILLVEDDELVTSALVAALTHDRHVVNIATDGEMGLELAEVYDYDLILLDLQIPKIDGIALCRELRSQGHKVPILLVTGKDSHSDKVAGLDAGADDYVVKPFDLSELKARIRALTRRGTAALSPVLTWEKLSLDPNVGEVTYDGKPLPLTPKEYGLLELFLRHPQRAFSRSAIIDRLWSAEDSPTENAVTTHMKDLRQKLKAAGLKADMIGTIYGLGYRLKPPPELPVPQPQAEPKRFSKLSSSEAGFASVQQVMERFRHTLVEQVAVLEQANSALQSQTLHPELQQLARQEAHKLAGSLGLFGYPAGSELARSIEHLLADRTAPEQEKAAQLSQLVTAVQLELAQPVMASQFLESEAAPPLAQCSSVTEAAPSSHPPFVLVIDSDQTLTTQLQAEAITRGMTIEVATDLAEARLAIAQTPPDVVLLNPSLGRSVADSLDPAHPEDNGLTLLAELSTRTPKIPVLVFTEQDSLSDRVEVCRLGGQGFLPKPISVELVFQAIAQALPRSEVAEAKVLVVDDDPAALMAICSLLQPWGLQITTLEAPQRFWEVLQATAPDLLVLDLEMPTFNGIELCQVVRHDPHWGDLPILVVTAHTDTKAVQQVFAAGADDFIAKPVVGPELVTRIISRLERVRLRQRLKQTQGKTDLQEAADQAVQAELLRVNQQLERCVQERTTYLEQANQELQQEIVDRQQTEQKLKLALQAAKLGFWQLNLTTGELSASHQCKANFGLSPDAEFSYERLFELIHPEERVQVRAQVQQALANHSDYEAEYRCIWPDGTVHWLLAFGRPTYASNGDALRMDGITLDITARKQAEAAQKELTWRITSILESITDAFFALDQEWRFTYLTPKAEQLLSRTGKELLGKVIWNEFPETVNSIFYEQYHKAVSEQISVTFEALYPPLNAWFEVRAYPAREGLSIYFQDASARRQADTELRQAKAELEMRVAERTAELSQINLRLQQELLERQQIEAALRVSQARFAGILEIANDAIISIDQQQRITLFNQGAEAMFGYTASEVLGQSLDLLLPHRCVQNHRQHVTDFVLSSRHSRQMGERREIFGRRQDGSEFATEASISKLDLGDEQVLTVILRDVTKKKQAETALRQSEAKFRSLSESSPVGVFMLNPEGHCIYINPRCQEICGLLSGEVSAEAWTRCIHVDDREQILTQRSKAIAEKQGFSAKERYVHPDGTVRHGRVQTAPILAADGELLGYVGTIEDITESRVIEQIKNEFISVVSHELRTPLTSIRGSLGLLGTGIYEDKPEKMKRMIEIALTDTDRLVRLVNDILHLERLESGKVLLTKQVCEVTNLMQLSVEAMQAIAKPVNITLTTGSSVTPTAAQVWANPDAIIQTLTNLLSNAIKFSAPNTTVSLWAERIDAQAVEELKHTKKRELGSREAIATLFSQHLHAHPSASTSHPSAYIRFAIQDQGRGIPQDKLESIFGRFQQVDASDSRQKGGTGLGLAICQSLIQQHGGQIWAESRLGEGSTFYFTLPIADL